MGVEADVVKTEEAARLALVLAGFASTMLTDFAAPAILDQLVQRIVHVLPVSSAGMTLMSGGNAPTYLAGSDASARRFEQLQVDLNEGPCVLAYQQGTAVLIPDALAEDRFPAFMTAAVELGLRAVFAFPLRHGGTQIGALDLYTTGPLTDSALATARILADVASAYLINARGRQDLQDSRDRAHHASLHDELTGLPNRTLLLDRMVTAFLRGKRSGRPICALFLDLDRLKVVNDTHGHQVGDELLIAVAARLASALRPGDTVARMSGDEFVVLCEDMDNFDAIAIATRLLEALSDPFDLSHVTVNVTGSVGIAYATHDDHTCEQLLQEADSAMYLAKRNGGNRIQMFDRKLQHQADTQLSLERDLSCALERGELHNAYQPIVTTGDGLLSGFEALIRWHHPLHGSVSPLTLIPLAEQNGQIWSIGAQVLNQAWNDQRRWNTTRANRPSGSPAAGPALTMAVNVSPRQLITTGFTDAVAALLDRFPAPNRGTLVLEVTETLFIRDTVRAIEVLTDLRSLGVAVALDDFGTGYSSLSYLDRFPVDIIKIDRSFISHLDRPSTAAIVKAVAVLAHDMNMTVVAEGVETAEQHQRVTDLGCDHSQGFYFARPQAASHIDQLIDHNRQPTLLPVSKLVQQVN